MVAHKSEHDETGGNERIPLRERLRDDNMDGLRILSPEEAEQAMQDAREKLAEWRRQHPDTATK